MSSRPINSTISPLKTSAFTPPDMSSPSMNSTISPSKTSTSSPPDMSSPPMNSTISPPKISTSSPPDMSSPSMNSEEAISPPKASTSSPAKNTSPPKLSDLLSRRDPYPPPDVPDPEHDVEEFFLVEPLFHDDDRDREYFLTLQNLVEVTTAGVLSKHKKKEASRGSSGVHLMPSASDANEIVSVFKPKDEEPRDALLGGCEHG